MAADAMAIVEGGPPRGVVGVKLPPTTSIVAQRKEAAMVAYQRIGEWVVVDELEITWEPLAEHGAVTNPTSALRALLVNLSTTDAGLFGPADPTVGVGGWVVVGYNNARAVVDVRRVNATDDADTRFYEVAFVSMERAFKREIHELIDRNNALFPR